MKEYRSRLDTPLKFHNFNRYFAIPLGTVLTLGKFIYEFSRIEFYTWFYTIDAIYYIALLILSIMTFIGFLSWKHYGYVSLMTILCVQVIYKILAISIFVIYLPSAIASNIGNAIGYLIYAIVAYIYYKKRELLFTSDYSEPYVPNTASQDTLTGKKPAEEQYALKQPQVLYCRKCGAALPLNSRFCKTCGTEILVSTNESSNL